MLELWDDCAADCADLVPTMLATGPICFTPTERLTQAYQDLTTILTIWDDPSEQHRGWQVQDSYLTVGTEGSVAVQRVLDGYYPTPSYDAATDTYCAHPMRIAPTTVEESEPTWRR